jgi:ribonuclease P protein component
MASVHAWLHVQDAQSFQLAALRVAHASQRKYLNDYRFLSLGRAEPDLVLVLPLSARLTSPHDFARTTKSGLRVTSEHFVGYLYINPAATESPRVGLIIGKGVGGSVRRHRVSRQIRHAVAPLINNFPEGSLIVFRGLKQNAEADVHGEITEISRRLIAKAQKRMADA